MTRNFLRDFRHQFKIPQVLSICKFNVKNKNKPFLGKNDLLYLSYFILINSQIVGGNHGKIKLLKNFKNLRKLGKSPE